MPTQNGLGLDRGDPYQEPAVLTTIPGRMSEVANTGPMDLRAAPPRWRAFLPKWLRALIWVEQSSSFSGFLSYSWKGESSIAPVVQAVIQTFLRPWYKSRALNIFRDLSSLAAGSNLQASLEQKLDQSQHLIVLASSAAATSAGMESEAKYWFSKARDGAVLVIVTEPGAPAWKDVREHLLPSSVREHLTSPPLWIDLSAQCSRIREQPFDWDKGQLTEALSQLILAFYPGRTWPELRGEERRLRMRALTLVLTTIVALSVATGVAIWKAVEATRQTARADAAAVAALRQRDETLRSQSLFLADLANQQTATGDSRLGLLLSLEALPKDPRAPDRPFVPQAQAALYRALTIPHEIAVFADHMKRVTDAAFVANGQGIVLSSLDAGPRLFDVRTGSVRMTLRDSSDPDRLGWHVAASPDGKRILTSSVYHTRLWDIDKEIQVAHITAGDSYAGRIVESAFTTTGDLVVTQCTGMVRVWAPTDGTERTAAASIQRLGMPIASDRNFTRLLIKSPDGTARIWDTRKDVELTALKPAPTMLETATFSPDGKRLTTYNPSEGGSATLWDAERGVELARLEGHNGVVTSYFSPRGDRIVTYGWDSRFSSGERYRDVPRLWKSDGGLIRGLEGHDGPVKHVAFSPSGDTLATASSDGTVKVWKSFDGVPVATLRGHRSEVERVQFSADGSRVVTASADGTARVWTVADPNLLATLPVAAGQYRYADFNRAAHRLIAGLVDGTTSLWDTDTWRPVSTKRSHRAVVLAAAWTTDGRQLVTAAADGSIYVWDASTGEQRGACLGHEGFIRDVRIDPRNATLVSAGDDGTARLWDLDRCIQTASVSPGKALMHALFMKSGAQVLLVSSEFIHSERTAWVWNASAGSLREVSSGVVQWAAVGDDVLLALSSNDGSVRVLRVSDGHLLSRFDTSIGKGSISASAFSVDGKYLALGWTNGAAAVWEVETGAKKGEFNGHVASGFNGQITVIVFTRDGKRILTGAVDRTARLWDTHSGRLVSSFSGHEDSVKQAVFAPDDEQVISLGGGLYAWDAESGEKIFALQKEKFGFIFNATLAEDGSVLTVVDSDRITLFKTFPSPDVIGFPTRLALINAGKNLRVAPLSGDERRRFYLSP